MISAVAIGFNLDELMKYPTIAWAHHDPSTAIGLSNREYMLMIKRAVEQADVVVVKVGEENLLPDEVVILHTAYTNKTPIIATSLRALSPLLEEMISQRLPGLDMIVDHITANYKLSK